MGTPPPPQPPPPPPPPQWGSQFPQQPADPGPPGPVDPSQITPRRFWYWIAGAIALVSVIGAILFAVLPGDGDDDGDADSLLGVFGTLQELQPPGEVTADLETGDEWAIYRLTQDSGGTSIRGGEVSCDVTGPDGQPVSLNSDLGFGTLTLNGEQYTTEYTFDATQPGSYRIACEVTGGPSVPLQVGQEVNLEEVFGFFGDIAGGFAQVILVVGILFLGLVTAGSIALAVWLSRSRKIAQARRSGTLQ